MSFQQYIYLGRFNIWQVKFFLLTFTFLAFTFLSIFWIKLQSSKILYKRNKLLKLSLFCVPILGLFCWDSVDDYSLFVFCSAWNESNGYFGCGLKLESQIRNVLVIFLSQGCRFYFVLSTVSTRTMDKNWSKWPGSERMVKKFSQFWW